MKGKYIATLRNCLKLYWRQNFEIYLDFEWMLPGDYNKPEYVRFELAQRSCSGIIVLVRHNDG